MVESMAQQRGGREDETKRKSSGLHLGQWPHGGDVQQGGVRWSRVCLRLRHKCEIPGH